MNSSDRTAQPLEGSSRDLDEGSVLRLGEYFQVARRRAALVFLTTMAVTIIVVIGVHRMPNRYRADTVILVDPQEVPGSLVAPIITSSVSDRLSTIQQEVTSPTRLALLIHSMNLFVETRKTASEHQVIAEMQRAISVQVVEPGGRGMSAFRVGFAGKNPVEVAEVANRLAELFISENLKLREEQSYGTAEFLDDEQHRTKQQLEEKEAELNEIKSKYMLDLPDSKQYHLETLATLRNQLRASQDRVNQAQQQKIYLQSLMTTQAPTVDLDSGAGAAATGSSAQVQRLEAQLSALRARYGDQYPDVKKIEAELREANRQTPRRKTVEIAPPEIRDAPSSASKPGNPVLLAQIAGLDEEITRARKEQLELEQQIAFHESKLQKIPLVEERISGVMRDYDSLRAHYTALENKKLDADTASALETHEKGERFHVLDRASVPSQPYAPKRTLISLAGLLAGLVFGLGLALLLEARQGAVHTKDEVVRLAGEIPILASIPHIRSAGEIRMQLFRLAGAFLMTAAGAVAAGVGLSYFTRSL